jgi:mitochondrial enoyl-[acyl-carrier protein] reductase / trans-2-enoyl-CoA reductase
MKQVKFNAFGPPFAVAACLEGPDVGDPSSWEVIVNVELFPINVADLAMLAGDYGTLPQLPATIGMEAVGTVAQCGEAVQGLEVGDRVVILANNNWSERRKVALTAVHKVPRDIDIAQLSLLKVNPATAYMLLNHFVKLEPGDWVVQSAPLSGVGQSILQLAKAQGIKTINVIHRPELKDQVLELGGDVVIEDSADLGERVRAATGLNSIRLALDAVAGPGIQRLADCLSDGAQIINYGMLSGESCVLAPEQTIFRGITLKGFWLSKLLNRMSNKERNELFGKLSHLIADQQLKIEIDSYYPLTDIRSALQRATERGRQGKVLVYTKFAPDHIKKQKLTAAV